MITPHLILPDTARVNGCILDDPSHERFYGSKNDRMPAFGKDEKLTRRQMERIVDWLRGE